jgi:hypothetical protein
MIFSYRDRIEVDRIKDDSTVLRIQETCHSALDEKEESVKRANERFFGWLPGDFLPIYSVQSR